MNEDFFSSIQITNWNKISIVLIKSSKSISVKKKKQKKKLRKQNNKKTVFIE